MIIHMQKIQIKTMKQVDDGFIDLTDSANEKTIPRKGNPDKVIIISEKFLELNKQIS